MQDLFVLSIIQGITEFLPLSSTAHIILLNKVFAIPTLGRVSEVALHMGTLLVVFAYFWRDILSMIEGFFSLLKGKVTPGLGLLWNLVIATLPAVGAGYLLHKYGGGFGRAMPLIGWVSIASGILLYVVDQKCSDGRKVDQLTWRDSFVIGVLQVLAFIPGASRSGMTIIAGRLVGLKRTAAARFSFLLSIPTITGAVTLLFFDIQGEAQWFKSPDLLTALCVSFFVGLFILFLLMRWLRTFTYTPFALYRIAFGCFILWYCYKDMLL